MITVTLYTGQVLQFPDGTAEDVIRRAAEEVLSGEADRKRQAAGSTPQPPQPFAGPPSREDDTPLVPPGTAPPLDRPWTDEENAEGQRQQDKLWRETGGNRKGSRLGGVLWDAAKNAVIDYWTPDRHKWHPEKQTPSSYSNPNPAELLPGVYMVAAEALRKKGFPDSRGVPPGYTKKVASEHPDWVDYGPLWEHYEKWHTPEAEKRRREAREFDESFTHDWWDEREEDEPDLSRGTLGPFETRPEPRQSRRSRPEPEPLNTERASPRELRLLDAERGGPEQMTRFGFLDRGMYYENPETGERVLKRRRVGQLPESLDPGYRPKTAIDRLHDAYEAEGRGVPTPERRAVDREFVRGIPARVVDSMAGMLLPAQALEAGIRGFGEEAKESAQALRTGRRSTGEGFARGAAKGFAEGELATGIGAVRRDLVDPDRERLIDAAVAAGMSPEVAASLDAAQLLTGEALNPGNYVGAEAFRVGGRGSRGGAAAARSSALESRGGARALEDSSGLVTREFGTKSAPSEIAQARAARSGIHYPGAREPLIELDLDPSQGSTYDDRFKGKIPDALRRATGRPWRSHGESLAEPASPAPRPRNVAREPISIPVKGGTPEERQRILALWDYTSRRYPRIASNVPYLEIIGKGRGGGARLGDGSIAIAGDADLGLMMHELTHVAQIKGRGFRSGISESYPVRMADTYSRIRQPTTTRLADIGEPDPDDVVYGNETPSYNPYADELPSPDADFEDWLDREGWQSDVLAPGQRVKLREQFYRETDPGYAAEAAESEARIAAQQAERARLLGRGAESEPGAPSHGPLEPDRLYSPPRPGSQPPAPAPQLPDEIVAERMGWKHPTLHPGSPAVAGPPIRIDEPGMRFQTNLAAQLGGDEQVANYIVQESDAVFRAIGPPQTWDTLEEMASRLGTSKEQFLSEASHWNVLAPEARLRLLYVIKGNEAKISGLQGKLVAGAATDAEKAELLRLIETRGDLIRLGAKSGSAYGRALNSLRMEARLALGDTQLLRQQLYKKYSKQLDAERPLLDALARLDPTDQNELQAFLRHVDRPKLREYVQEFWVSSILSGPASHERNLIGNAVNALVENAAVRPLAGVWDAARVAGASRAQQIEYLQKAAAGSYGNASSQAKRILSAAQAQPDRGLLSMWEGVSPEARLSVERALGRFPAEREVFLRETPRALIGLTLGIRQGVRRGIRVLKTGYDPDSMSGKLFPVRSAFARSQNRVVREVVGPVVTMPLRLLAASDALFKTMNWNAEIYAQAARIAAKKGLDGKDFVDGAARLVANPTDEMIDAADNFALKATFNDPASAFGSAIINLRDFPNIQPQSKVGRFGLDSYRTIAGFAIPFVKIADRLMVRGFEYTPIGALKAIGARQAGNLAESADLAARASFGSVILAYAASLAMEGRLTAGAPTDEAEKAAFYGANKQAWSVRTEDGTWIPYGGLQPIGTPFALAAAAWKGWTEHGEDPDVEKLGHAAAEIGVYLTDQSYMDGLSKFMDAIAGSEMGRGRAFSDFATNTTWGFTPYSGLARTVAKGIDPRVIDAQSIPDKLRQNVPGTSLGMQARLTPWGEDVVPVGGRLRSVLAPGSVLLPSREKPNALDEELARLGMPLWYVGKTISDKLGSGKSRGPWKLSQEEWYVYQQTAGRMTKRTLAQLFSKPGYATWDIEKQREETEKAIGAAREYARIQVVRYHRGFGPPGLNPR